MHEGEFCCIGENTEKYKMSAVPITKEVRRTGKNEEENAKIISYGLQFIDGWRLMASWLSNLFDNLVEGIHRFKCKYRCDNKKCEICGIKYKDCEFVLNTQALKII